MCKTLMVSQKIKLKVITCTPFSLVMGFTLRIHWFPNKLELADNLGADSKVGCFGKFKEALKVKTP